VLEVKQLRLARKWNQTELAYHAGLAPSVISEIENGKRDPSARTLRKLAEALEVDVADLFPKGQAPLPLEEASRPAVAAELPGLKAARQRSGVSRSELAALSGLTVLEIDDLEEGEPLADAIPVEPLAAALNVSVTELMFPAEQVAAFLSFEERDNERIRLEMEKLDANDFRALMLASPALRKLSDAFRKGQEDRGRPESEAC
jgi:transcriptional regulator with XRE-family HTH domain